MIASGDQNHLPSSFAPLGDLLKALMFLSNLNGFKSPPHHWIMSSPNEKVLSRCGRNRAPSDFVTSSFSLPFLFLFFHYLCVLHYCFESV